MLCCVDDLHPARDLGIASLLAWLRHQPPALLLTLHQTCSECYLLESRFEYEVAGSASCSSALVTAVSGMGIGIYARRVGNHPAARCASTTFICGIVLTFAGGLKSFDLG
jgi:hypothetical protein